MWIGKLKLEQRIHNAWSSGIREGGQRAIHSADTRFNRIDAELTVITAVVQELLKLAANPSRTMLDDVMTYMQELRTDEPGEFNRGWNAAVAAISVVVGRESGMEVGTDE